jgi:hypothetical protein
MAIREEVYKAIDSERDYQDSLWSSGTMANKTIGDWVSVIRVYLRRAEDAWTYDSEENVMDYVRKIAGIGAHAMEKLGIVRRSIAGLNSFTQVTSRQDVYEALDAERSYQDQKWGTLDSRNSVGDFLTYMVELSRKADELSNPDYPERSLDIIRKITGVAVACMEQHGAPHRREPDYGKPKDV